MNDLRDSTTLKQPMADMKAAQRFLDLMAEGEPVTFQTFADSDDQKHDRTLASWMHGYLDDDTASQLQRLNGRGAGVFWMVNYGNGKGRRTENVTGIRALFLDLDGAPLGPVLDAGIEPHAVIESSPGKWHVYWLVTGCTLADFEGAQRALAAKFGGDPVVHDLPRVMRLPGFVHCKGNPFVTRMERLEAMQPYEFGHLQPLLDIPAQRSQAPIGGRNNELSRRAYAMRKQGKSIEEIEPALQALNAALPQPLSAQEVHQIAVGKERIQPDATSLQDFYAHMPSHQYLFVPTRELWPASSVNGRLPWPEVGGKPVAPAAWLDKHRAVEQMAWHPAEPEVIHDRVLQVAGWVAHGGATVFNLYRPPVRPTGDAALANPWRDHLERVYPDHAAHIARWLAHRVQRPGEKCNHALVLGGLQGIGKDTLLEPLKAAVGPWNWSEISPAQMLGRFNGWVKATVVRINEARDLGDVDRFGFYDHSKTIIAAPPDVLRVDEKHLRETYVANVCGVIITTNHLGDGLYLPADDRRHYVAWSPRTREDFSEGYWRELYSWFAAGGIGHVCDYLQRLDLSDFDPKAPPEKTPAFWQIVAAGEAPESGELRDLIEALGDPQAITLADLIVECNSRGMLMLSDELGDRKTRRSLPHKLERVGYVPVRNPDATDGLFKIAGKRQAVYALRQLPLAEQIRAARARA